MKVIKYQSTQFIRISIGVKMDKEISKSFNIRGTIGVNDVIPNVLRN